MSHEQILSETCAYQIEQYKATLQQARQEVSFFAMEQRALALRSDQDRLPLRPSALPLVLTQISAHPGEHLTPAPLFQDNQTGTCLNVDAQLFLPEQLTLFRQSAPETFVLLQAPLVDEYQILQAKVAGIQALAFSPSLLGARRAQLYFEKIGLWGILPVVEIKKLQDLPGALILSPDILLLQTGFKGSAAYELVSLIRQQTKKNTRIIFQGEVDSPEEWLHLQGVGVDCFCLSAQNLDKLAKQDIYMQMSRPHPN
ncbi:MAG: hypothetical protein AB7I41_19310 [Candidatus Sericytochromatia bacterium]